MTVNFSFRARNLSEIRKLATNLQMLTHTYSDNIENFEVFKVI